MLFIILVGRRSSVQNWSEEKINKKKKGEIRFKNAAWIGVKNSIKTTKAHNDNYPARRPYYL